MSYRGTQGITYHVVERKTGRSLAAKSMHGAGDFMDYMKAEMDIMNQLCHPRLVRLWDAHEAKSSLTLAMDMYLFSRNIFIHIINMRRTGNMSKETGRDTAIYPGYHVFKIGGFPPTIKLTSINSS